MFQKRSYKLLNTSAPSSEDVSNIHIAANGTHVAIKVGKNPLQVLELGDEVITRRIPYKQNNQVGGQTFALSPDGQLIATYDSFYQYSPKTRQGEYDDWIQLWNTKSGKLVREYQWHVDFPQHHDPRANILKFQFSHDGHELIAMTEQGEVVVWSTVNGNFLRLIGQAMHHAESMALSHQGDCFASFEHSLEESTSALPLGRYFEFGNRLYGFHSPTCYKFSREGMTWWLRHKPTPVGTYQVGYIAEPIAFKLWDAYSGAEIRDFEDFEIESNIRNLHFSHDDHLLSGEVDGAVYLWNVDDGCLAQKIEDTLPLHLVGFSKDDRHLICRSERRIHAWDVEQKEWIAVQAFTDEIVSASISGSNRIAVILKRENHWSVSILDF